MEERYAIRKGAIPRAASLSNREGCHTARIPESGNLPFLLVQNPPFAGFRSRGIDRTVFRLSCMRVCLHCLLPLRKAFLMSVQVQKGKGKMNELITNKTIFEDIKHIDEFGNEYWEARELMRAL